MMSALIKSETEAANQLRISILKEKTRPKGRFAVKEGIVPEKIAGAMIPRIQSGYSNRSNDPIFLAFFESIPRYGRTNDPNNGTANIVNRSKSD